MVKRYMEAVVVGALLLALSVPVNGDGASRRDFETIASQLDPGGELFLVLQSGRWIDRLLENLTVGGDADIPATDTDEQTVREQLEQTRRFLNRAGISAWRGGGVSSSSQRGGRHKLKLFVLRDAVDANLPFWRGLFGWQPRRLMSLDFVPAGFSMVQAGTVESSVLWDLMCDCARETGGLSTQLRFDSVRAAITTWLGLQPDDLFASLRDELLVAVQFEKEMTFSLPVSWGELSLPAPSFLVLVATGEDVLRGVVEAKLASLNVTLTESEVAGIKMRYAESPLEGMPFPLQPALASASGFTVLGSSPAVVESALLAYRHRNGLVTRPGFKKAFLGLPMVNNGIVYVDTDAARLVQHAIQSRREAQQPVMESALSSMARIDESLRMGEDGLPTCAWVIRNWKHGVMVNGYSGIGGEMLLRGMGASVLEIWNGLWQRSAVPGIER